MVPVLVPDVVAALNYDFRHLSALLGVPGGRQWMTDASNVVVAQLRGLCGADYRCVGIVSSPRRYGTR
jgi:hypothetical protein